MLGMERWWVGFVAWWLCSKRLGSHKLYKSLVIWGRWTTKIPGNSRASLADTGSYHENHRVSDDDAVGKSESQLHGVRKYSLMCCQGIGRLASEHVCETVIRWSWSTRLFINQRTWAAEPRMCSWMSPIKYESSWNITSRILDLVFICTTATIVTTSSTTGIQQLPLTDKWLFWGSADGRTAREYLLLDSAHQQQSADVQILRFIVVISFWQ